MIFVSLRALNLIQYKKKTGLDGISTRLLKVAAHIIADPIANIFNLSLQTTIFPNDWTLAIVTPVFKDGNKNDWRNYRPISVVAISGISTVKIVYDNK